MGTSLPPRLAIIEYAPLLAAQLGTEFFEGKLGELCMSWLGDSVSAIRQAAASNLQKLSEEFGAEWANENVVPDVLEMIKSSHYLYRMNTLEALGKLAPIVGTDTLCSKLLPEILACAKDKVPNIRFGVAKLTQTLVPLVDSSVIEHSIKPCLLELQDDADVDVRYFAQEALNTCQESVAG